MGCRRQGAQFAAALYRTKVLQLNLNMSIATATLGALAVVGGTFGMNLPSGLEESDTALFWQVAGQM